MTNCVSSGTLNLAVLCTVSSRLDYCNSLLYGVNDGLLKQLQIVDNAAARVVTGARKFDHISPVLCELHWLPVCHRITYKLATDVYKKCLHELAPLYLSDDCSVPVTTVAGRPHLRSADSRCLVVPRTRTVLATRNFAVAGPLVCNSLPANIHSACIGFFAEFCRETKDIKCVLTAVSAGEDNLFCPVEMDALLLLLILLCREV